MNTQNDYEPEHLRLIKEHGFEVLNTYDKLVKWVDTLQNLTEYFTIHVKHIDNSTVDLASNSINAWLFDYDDNEVPPPSGAALPYSLLTSLLVYANSELLSDVNPANGGLVQLRTFSYEPSVLLEIIEDSRIHSDQMNAFRESREVKEVKKNTWKESIKNLLKKK